MVKEKWMELNVFCIMSNHIHLIWQIQAGYERDAVQRNFLRFVSQTIQRDLKKHHPKVLERFYVNAKDRKYHPDDKRDWKRNPLSIDLWTKEVFILRRSNDSFGESFGQKMEYVHNNPVTAGLCFQPEDYQYSSAKFYERDIDDPIAIGFGILTHWMS